MYKRIIFDLDNTLIIWKNEYIKGLDNTIKYFNLNIDVCIVDEVINSLESKYDKLSKKLLLKEINDATKLNLDMSFVNKLFEEQKNLSEINEDLIDTLKYLSSKYELVVLTNYFKEVQVGRLKHALIDKYFKTVIGGDEVLQKPNFESFEMAVGNFKKSECIMVGDNLKIDIEGAINFGIHAIVCDYFNLIPSSNKYLKIQKISELKNIL